LRSISSEINRAYLWVIDLNYAARLHHGGLLRYFNLARELVAQGHSVTFAVCYQDDPEKGREWMESQKAQRVCTKHCALTLPPLPRWNKLATLLLPFGMHRLAIRPFVRATSSAITGTLRQYPADVVLVSSRELLFAAAGSIACPSIGDFSDSVTLYIWRELVKAVRQRQLRASVRHLLDLYHYFFQELYGSRRYSANIMVSLVDKRVFDAIGKPEKNVCIMNGVREGSEGVKKIAGQIVFSGAMNFPPNHDGALWFLDHVFPLVLKKLPHLIFVIVGANPPEMLMRRAAPNIKISGFVPDLNHMLAESALYVAPLISGSGFKNKVAEAIANGTYVIGTSFAVEFLEPVMRELVTVKDDPREMAEAICEFFLAPEKMNDKLVRLRQMVKERFSWPAKAAELADLGDAVALRKTMKKQKVSY